MARCQIHRHDSGTRSLPARNEAIKAANKLVGPDASGQVAGGAGEDTSAPQRNRQTATAPPSLDGRLTYRVREVVSLTGLSQSTIYELMARGSLRTTKVRNIRLIYASSLRELLLA